MYLRKNMDVGMYFLLLALISFLPLPFGGNRPWAVNLIEVIIFLLAAYTITLALLPKYLVTPITSTASIILGLFSLTIFYQLFQIVPLPSEFVALISPNKYSHMLDSAIISEYMSISFGQMEGLFALIKNIAFIAVFYICYQLINTLNRLRVFLAVVVAVGLFQALYGIIDMYAIQHGFLGREFNHSALSVSGSFINRNHFSAFIIFSLGACLALYFLPHKTPKITMSPLLNYKNHLKVYSVIFLTALLYSQSRGAELAVVVSGVIGIGLYLYTRNQKWKKLFYLLVTFLPFIFFICFMGFEGWLDRFGLIDSHANQRFLIWETSLALYYDYWLTGVGSGNFQYLYPMYQSIDSEQFVDHAHNDYLELLVEQGVIGFVLLSIALAYSFREIFKRVISRRHKPTSRLRIILLITLIAILLHSFVEFVFQIPVISIYFFAFLSLAVREFEEC